MTTVAWDGHTMAADTLLAASNVRDGAFTKIVKRKDGALCGCAGAAAKAYGFHKWFLAGEKREHPCIGEEGFNALVVRPDKQLMLYDQVGRFEFKSKYTAIGTGFEIALGAMAVGGSAADAVSAAMEHDSNTGGSIQVMEPGK